MDNFDKLVEKYKTDMVNTSRRSLYVPEELFFEDDEEKQEPVFEAQEAVKAASASVKAESEPAPPTENKNESGENYGTLKVMVFAGNEAFPVETAKVEVFDKKGNLLYSLMTNSGGIAENMKLKTPDSSENDEPGGADGFSLYDIVVSHPDYDTEIFENVQMFEGIESIQPVFLQVKDAKGYNIISEASEE